jgi:hypothetical protein
MDRPASTLFQKPADSTEQENVESTNSKALRMIKRSMHRWHRTIGVVVIIPVIFWTLSGTMHPFMAHWFKPAIARETIMPGVIPEDQIILSIQQVLRLNGFSAIRNFRIVKVKGKWYYQVKTEVEELEYFSATDGKLLPDADRLHAEELSRYFLNDTTSSIKSAQKITEFTSQYREVNRFLPVWKISFDRSDEMDVYVDTEQTKMGTFNNSQRKTFLWIFNNFHMWDWLNEISNNRIRLTVMILTLTVIIGSALSGILIYGFMWKKFRRPSRNDKVGMLRKHHRKIGIAVAFVTLTFAFSGAYHATTKYTPDDRINYVYQPLIKTDEFTTASVSLPIDWGRFSNISITKIEKNVFYQIFYAKTEDEPSAIIYLNASTGRELEQGSIAHGKYLAKKFYFAAATNQPTACCETMESYQEFKSEEMPAFQQAELITAFTREYGFVNKRLPVVKLSYDTPDNLTYYVEPSTGRLAAKITDAERTEGYSFAILHKFLFMDWAGKNVRDAVMLFSALGVLVVSVLGLVLFIRIKK